MNLINNQIMTLLDQLKNLKTIQPDKQWKIKNQEILFHQISNSTSPVVLTNQNKLVENLILAYHYIIHLLRHIIHLLRQPAWAVCFILIIFGMSAVAAAHVAARYSQPGDSLYVAKIINEKAQLAVTFDQEKQSNLEFKFATGHAKDITKVLNDLSAEHKDKAEKLSQDFKKEIKIARESIKSIKSKVYNDIDQSKNRVENIDQDNKADQNNHQSEQSKELTQVFSADLGRKEKGMQVFKNMDKQENNIEKNIENTESATNTEKITNSVTTSTDNSVGVIVDNADIIGTASSTLTVSSTAEILNLRNTEQVLDEAEKLFDEKNYSGVLEKLEEIKIRRNKIEVPLSNF